MSEKHKKTCKYLNYIVKLLILASRITGCVLISAIVSLVAILTGTITSAVGLEICVFTAGIKKRKSIFKKKRKKKYNEVVLLGKTKLNTIQILVSRGLTDSYISHDEFLSVNNVLKE